MGAGGRAGADAHVLVGSFGFSPCCALVVAFERNGGMPLFLAKGGKIARVYACNEHFTGPRAVQVDQVWCLERSIAVLLHSGDVRHFEFLIEGEIISLTEMPIDQPPAAAQANGAAP